MNKNPKVSIIMPSLNVVAYIRECIESVIQQTLHEIEIICVDAGSTDGTLDILGEFCAKDKRIRIIHSDKKSYGHQMNLGIDAAQGEYIGIVETDDFVDYSMFSDLFSFAQKCGNVDIVKSSYWIYSDNEKPENSAKPAPILSACKPEKSVFNVFEYPEIIYHHPSIWSCIYRREFLNQNNLRFIEAPGAGWVDNPFMLATFCEAKTIAWTPKAYYYYRISNPNASSFVKDCSMPFCRTSEMLAFCKRKQITDPNILRSIYKRILWNAASTLDNPNYVPENDDEMILSQIKAVDPDFLNDSRVRDVERKAYAGFMKKLRINAPKVSIIMPSLNVGSYIRECIQSVVSQTLKDIEIICVDAGSTDGTLEILEEYAANDQRIKVIMSDKKSYGYQMNLGLNAARGEYIGIVETDDFITNDMFAKLYEHSDGQTTDVVKSNFYTYFSTNGKKTTFSENLKGAKYGEKCGPEDFVVPFLAAPGTCNAIYRREFLLQNNIGWNETPGAAFQDTSFNYKVWICADSAYFMKDAFYYYRRDVATSSVRSSDKIYQVCHEYEAAEDFLSQHPEKKALFEKLLWMRKVETYRWNYERLPDRFREEFLMRMYEEFSTGIAEGKFELQLFEQFNWMKNWEMLHSILKDPEMYYLTHRGSNDVTLDNITVLPGSASCSLVVVKENLQKDPLVSVIIPAYNTEDYLADCLESVINQSLRNIEIICVDDGSVDNTPDILNKYASEDNRISILRQTNRGLASARNTGLTYAKGKYIQFLDSDDFLVSNALEKLYEVSEAENLDVLYFDAISIFETVELAKTKSHYVTCYQRSSKFSQTVCGQKLYTNLVEDGVYQVSACLQFIQRDYLKRNDISFHEGMLYEDHYFTTQTMLKAKYASHRPFKLYMRRVHDGSIMTTAETFKNFYGYFTNTRLMLEFRVNNSLYSDTLRAIDREIENNRQNAERILIKLSQEEKLKLNSLTMDEKLLAFACFKSMPQLSVDSTKLSGINAATDTFTKIQIDKLQQEIEDIRRSISYRIGRIITWLPRKVRGGIRCYREHGMRYTMNRILVKVHFKQDPYKR